MSVHYKVLIIETCIDTKSCTNITKREALLHLKQMLLITPSSLVSRLSAVWVVEAASISNTVESLSTRAGTHKPL